MATYITRLVEQRHKVLCFSGINSEYKQLTADINNLIEWFSV